MNRAAFIRMFGSNHDRGNHRARQFRPRVEALENRVVLYNVTDPWGTHTISYSYSNLTDGGIRGLDNLPLNPGEVSRAILNAMGSWSAVAGLAFYAQTDSGPYPSDSSYDRENHPTIRWGHHPIDGPGGYQGHGYNPGGNGLDGDIHIDDQDTFDLDMLRAIATHELGHAVGMEHEDDVLAVMNTPTIVYNLQPDDIAGIRSLYGAGLGYVLDYSGVMHVFGTKGNDLFTVSTSANDIQITNVGIGTMTMGVAGIQSIWIHGREGNDTFTITGTANRNLWVDGDEGDDTFFVAGNMGWCDTFVRGGLDNDTVRVDIDSLTASVGSVAVESGSTRVFYNMGDASDQIEAFGLDGNDYTTLTVTETPPLLTRISDIDTVKVHRMTNRLDVLWAKNVTVGNGTTSGITGEVHLEFGNYVNLTIDDAYATQPRHLAVRRNSVEGLPGVVSWANNVHFSEVQVRGGRGGLVNGVDEGNTITVHDTPSTRVRIDTGTGADFVRVFATSSALEINGQDGDDWVHLGHFGSVRSIRGPVTITNDASYSTVVVDDSADIEARTVILYDNGTYNLVSGLTPFGDIQLRESDLAALTIYTGGGHNTYRIHDTPRSAVSYGLTTTIHTGAGNDTITVDGTTGTLALDAQDGFNSITVGHTSVGVDRILGVVDITGAGGINSVAVNDLASAGGQVLTHTVTATSYRRSGTASVYLSGLFGFSLQAGSAADVINVQGNPTLGGFSQFELRGGNNNDTFNIGNAARQLTGIGTVMIDGEANLEDGDALNIFDDGAVGPKTYHFGFAFGSSGPPLFTSPDCSLWYTGIERPPELFAGPGGNIIRVQGLASAVSISPGAGDDLIEIGNAMNLLADIPALTIVDSGGMDRLLLRDQGQSTPRFYSADGAAFLARPLSGAGPTTALSVYGIEAVTLNAGSAGDLFRIASTAGGALAVNAGGGDDTMIVASYALYDENGVLVQPADELDLIVNPLQLDGQDGTDSLSFNDQGNDVGATYAVTPFSLQRSGAALVSHGGLESVTINGTADDDVFSIEASAAGPNDPTTTFEPGGGANTLDYSDYTGSSSGPPLPPRSTWHQAEGDFTDSAGANHGTPYNGVAFDSGQTGQAYRFDGDDDHVDLGNDPSLDLPGSVTVAAWIQYEPHSNETGYVYFLADFNAGGTVSQGSLGILGARLFWYQTTTEGDAAQPIGATDLVAGQWHHVAVVRDDGAKTVTLFVDGMADGSVSYSGTVVGLQQTKVLGTSLPDGFPEDHFAGLIDEVSIFASALSAAQIERLAAGDPPAASNDVIVNLVLGTATGWTGAVHGIDQVIGGSGNDILVGLGGSTLRGGGGRDLLIAGVLSGSLFGGDDDDILIAGSTDYDADATALEAIRAAWSRTDEDYDTRVARLSSGSDVPALNASTVHSNGGDNTLAGEGERDLFFALLALDWLDDEEDESLFAIEV